MKRQPVEEAKTAIEIRNRASLRKHQLDILAQASDQPRRYVWAPPGMGKGYIYTEGSRGAAAPKGSVIIEEPIWKDPNKVLTLVAATSMAMTAVAIAIAAIYAVWPKG